jgi:hypothetical protein
VRRWVDEIVVVPEDDVAEAVVFCMERAKLVVEGAGAVGVAALLGGQAAAAPSGTTCVVLSGGNVDAGLLAVLARRHETEAGRRLDPWWDIHQLLAYDDSWRDFIPVQVAGRAPVDLAGMTDRVEELLAHALARL